jgi:sulfoxide reductase heme-binding subunit YedZ
MSTLLATATGTHVFWITSRAAGIVAMLLASVSVGLGLSMGGRLIKGRTADLRTAHEALSIGTLAAIALHAGALLFDSYLKPSLADVTVPFASSYAQPWTSLGIVCGWVLMALGLSYYARARIGVARWRRLHRWSALVWLLSLVHALGEGTDAGQLWFLVSAGIVVVPAAALLAVRYLPAPSPKASRT